MKWKKLGKIFNPIDYNLDYAQAPNTLIFDDFIRVYFSTRIKDNKGKYLSNVAYVDYDKNFNILKVSNHEIIPLGELGSFDEHGIFPISILEEKDRLCAYTTGWNRKASVNTDGAIGLSISRDNGETFTKFGQGPIVNSSLQEPFLIGDACVKKYNDIYHMWYIFGAKWIFDKIENIPQRIYKISHAISFNGIDWKKEGKYIINNVIEDECQALPTIIYFDKTYHMFFCYRYSTNFRNVKERSYRIGYTRSYDLINWKREDSQVGIDVTDNNWDSDMMCYPHVFEFNTNIYMLYNGNEFGRYGFGLAILEEK